MNLSVSDKQRPSIELLADKYEVLEPLGGGGMGHVFRARHRQLKRLVAIKLLSQDLAEADAVARFLREARAVARIGSPHVAHVMDAGVLPNGQPFIVMEYLQGKDLGALIAQDGRLQPAQAVDFVLQALEAIAEAHAQQIVHRDIKPANLFMTRSAAGDSLIKVLDFGLAKTSPAFDTLAPGITERGAVLGTPSYMSPEQFLDAQDADVRSDIWALGATLFELLTGTPPFTGNSLPQVYRAVMQRSVPTLRSLIPELPEALDNVVATCLTRQRELRYADVAELASALSPWAGQGGEARAEHIRRILSQPPETTSPDLSAALDAAKRLGALSRTLAASRVWPVALLRRKRYLAVGAIGMVLAALAVTSSSMLQPALSEHPSAGQKTVQQPVASVGLDSDNAPSSAVDSQHATSGSVSDAGAQLTAAVVPEADQHANQHIGTDAAEASGDTTPTAQPVLKPELKPQPKPASTRKPGLKATPKPAPVTGPRRPDPSIYDQYP